MSKPVDLTYYETLGVKPDASGLEIKKQYRKLAVIHHPDKNPGDENANAKFQAIGEAYQVLSDPDLRDHYNRYGKSSSQPEEGFIDPAEFFGKIFGGEAFVDLIGEISLMKDLTHTMEMTAGAEDGEEEFPGTEAAKEASIEEEKKRAAAAAQGTSSAQGASSSQGASSTPSLNIPRPSSSGSTKSTPSVPNREKMSASPAPSSSSGPAKRGIPLRAALKDKSEADILAGEGNLTEDEKNKKGKKKGALTPEQREKMLEYEREKNRIRKERVETLARKLVDRISVWTETDKGADVTKAFEEKTRLQVDDLKMESFGLDILHAVGMTYLQKANAVLNSKSFLGMGGFFSKTKDKFTLVKETWNTVASAIDAQMTMDDMQKREAAGGDDWTEEKKMEFERRVTGKVLSAAWKGSRFEIQSVLRDVCDAVLNDKAISKSKKFERAQAIAKLGEIYLNVRAHFFQTIFILTLII